MPWKGSRRVWAMLRSLNKEDFVIMDERPRESEKKSMIISRFLPGHWMNGVSLTTKGKKEK